MFGIRFASYGPHDNTGVIFVPCDEIPQYLFMVLPDWECFIGITAFPGTDADRRCFIDDNDAFPVAEPVNFLCIGIMAGAEGIGVHPVQQIDIFYIKAQIQPSSVKRRILMLAEALEIKGLSIDQKLCPFDFYRAETELFCIAVFSIIYLRLIQIRSTRIRLCISLKQLAV